MISLRAVAIAAVVVVGAHPLVAQELFRYRAYALEASLGSVVKISGLQEDETKTLHERPAKIQELKWRAPYVRAGTPLSDPVRDLLFSFYNGQLYRIVVTYDRDRMEGLTNDDLIESLSATYGLPLLQDVGAARSAVPTDMPGDTTVVAQWDDAASLVTLTRSTYPSGYQLILISKTLEARARAAINEALRLDTEEAPQRELDHRKKAAAAANAAGEKARVLNKAAFRP